MSTLACLLLWLVAIVNGVCFAFKKEAVESEGKGQPPDSGVLASLGSICLPHGPVILCSVAVPVRHRDLQGVGRTQVPGCRCGTLSPVSPVNPVVGNNVALQPQPPLPMGRNANKHILQNNPLINR